MKQCFNCVSFQKKLTSVQNTVYLYQLASLYVAEHLFASLIVSAAVLTYLTDVE